MCIDELCYEVSSGMVMCCECEHVFHPKKIRTDEYGLAYDDEYMFEHVRYVDIDVCRCPACGVEQGMATEDFLNRNNMVV